MVNEHRISVFLDGSRVQAYTKHHGLSIKSFDGLARHIFESGSLIWQKMAFEPTSKPSTRLLRTYWFSIGSQDEWNLESQSAQATLSNSFFRDHVNRGNYLNENNVGISKEEHWENKLNEIRSWYDSRKKIYEGIQKFNHKLKTSTQLTVVDSGHIKLDMLNLISVEKGIDSGLAAYVAGTTSHYDAAFILADEIEAMMAAYQAKIQGKQIGIVVLSKSETQTGNISKYVSNYDFIININPSELVKKGIAESNRNIT